MQWISVTLSKNSVNKSTTEEKNEIEEGRRQCQQKTSAKSQCMETPFRPENSIQWRRSPRVELLLLTIAINFAKQKHRVNSIIITLDIFLHPIYSVQKKKNSENHAQNMQ